MNNRGEVWDMMIFLITIFVLAVGFFVLMFVIPSITTGLRTAGLNSTYEGENAIAQLNDFGTNGINNGFMLIFWGLTASMMITSFFVRTHPIFLFLYILFLIVTVIVSFYIGNAYHQLIDNPIFAGMVGTATFSTFVMNNIAEITIATVVLSMIIVFAKFSTFGGTQQF